MKEVTYGLNESSLVIKLSYRIDSTNADPVEAEINRIIGESSFEHLVLDLDNLEYISSAGLRIVLRLKKQYKDIKLINANSEVYEIFEMTGFTEMLDVEKAYRKLSVDGCEVIGEGANGKVYKYDNETIIKVYENGLTSIDDIKRERELARKAFVLDIPTAISYDIVKVGDNYGSVFELLEAKSFAKLLIQNEENLNEYVKLYVDLVKTLHETELKPGELPSMKDNVIKWVKALESNLNKATYDKIYSMIQNIKDDNHMMHGDYHIKNVMMQKNEVLLIDMDTLCTGNKIFEFAFMFNAYQGFSFVDHENILNFMGISYELGNKFFREVIKYYFNSNDESFVDSVVKKSSIVGYTRIISRMIRHNDKIEQLPFFLKEYERLINEVDDLNL